MIDDEKLKEMVTQLRGELATHRHLCKALFSRYLKDAGDYAGLVDEIDRVAASTCNCENKKHFIIAALARLGYLEIACEDEEGLRFQESEN